MKNLMNHKDSPRPFRVSSTICSAVVLLALQASTALAVDAAGDHKMLTVNPSEKAVFPEFSAQGTDVSVFTEMLKKYHPAVNMDIAGTYALAWLPGGMLWVGEASPVSESPSRARTARRLGSMRITPEGYVSCHQHEGLAHSEGWPFPLPEQGDGFSFYFTLAAGLPYGPEFKLPLVTTVDGWKLQDAKTTLLDAKKGWTIELTGADAIVTSPPFNADALSSPFIRVKWDASGLPPGSKPYLEWTTKASPEFSPQQRMEFPRSSTSSHFPIQDFDIPVEKLTGAQGRITGLRIGFGNPAPGSVTLVRVFSAVDSRHVINNPNYIIGSADFYNWTADTQWLLKNMPKLRKALAYMIKEFSVRETGVLHRPWTGHDGRSGVEITPSGNKIIHKGLGIGSNYWDLMPFGGEDPIATVYLYAALLKMAELEEFTALSHAAATGAPETGLDAASLRDLAQTVRAQFQKKFWNPETKRFAALDDQRNFRDYGFTFLNNEAIFYGLASDRQAHDILDWTSGQRIVEGDTSTGADIYRWRFGPRSTTKRNLDYYQYVWPNPEALAFGDQVQDGGAVLGFSYHDIIARLRCIGADNAWARVQAMFDWYREVEAGGGARAYYAVPGRGTLQGGGTAGGIGIDQEFYESVLVPAIVLDGFLGFIAHPDGFTLNPHLPKEVISFRITNMAYRKLLWDVEFSQDTITFEVRSGAVDAPLRVRLPAGTWTVDFGASGAVRETVAMADGKEGFTLPAGPLERLNIKRKVQ